MLMVEPNTIRPSSSETMISINVKPFCFFIVVSREKRLTGGIAGEARFTGNWRRTGPYSPNVAKNNSCNIAAGAERYIISAYSTSPEIKRTVVGSCIVHIDNSAETASGYCFDCARTGCCAITIRIRVQAIAPGAGVSGRS